MRPVLATAVIDVPREALYGRLADLREHWSLAAQWIEPVALDGDGAVVRLRGPLAVRRTARTRLLERDAPARLAGEARVGATAATISWTLEEAGPAATRVTLRADITRLAAADRVVLSLGGRRWLRNRFLRTLDRLRPIG